MPSFTRQLRVAAFVCGCLLALSGGATASAQSTDGGGHRALASRRRVRLDRGYDCSGSVSHALLGGHFLRSPLDSSSFETWGRSGPGTWITVYTNSGHAYLVVAGLRLDTGMRDDPTRTGPAWGKKLRRSASYTPRHPRGF